MRLDAPTCHVVIAIFDRQDDASSALKRIGGGDWLDRGTHLFLQSTADELRTFVGDTTGTRIGPQDPAVALHGARRGLAVGAVLGTVLGLTLVAALLGYLTPGFDLMLQIGGAASGAIAGATVGGIAGLGLGMLADLLSVVDCSRFFCRRVPRGGLLQLEVDPRSVRHALRRLGAYPWAPGPDSRGCYPPKPPAATVVS